MSESPNYYSTYHLMSATSCQWAGSTWAYDVLAFDFPATNVQIFNACGDPLFFSLKAQALTTRDGYIPAATLRTFEGIRTGGLSLMTTSSSCASRPRVSISAWASA